MVFLPSQYLLLCNLLESRRYDLGFAKVCKVLPQDLITHITVIEYKEHA